MDSVLNETVSLCLWCDLHPGGGGGYFLIRGYWGFAAGWGRIFTTGLTIMGLYF